MKQQRKCMSTALASLLFAYCGAAGSAILYTQTLQTTPAAVANTDPTFPFTNCVAAQGCFGNAGLVDTPAGGNLPGAFTFNFTLTAGEITAIINAGSAVLSVLGARDIGHKAGDAATDWLVTSIEGNALGNLFQTTIDSCPPGERGGAGFPQTLVCGPNFHTDVTAVDSLSIPINIFKAAAADGTIQIVLDPTDSVGRLKLFSVKLEAVSAVPEPATLGLAVLGLAALGFGRRRKPA